MTKNDETHVDPAITADEKRLIDQLSEATISHIDQTLLSNASPEWCQTSRLVLTTMIELDNGMGLPKTYFVQRLQHLVRKGLLETKGDLTQSRASEVRLKQ